MYFARTPALIKPLLKGLVWDMPAPEPTVYLTFDDGPIPEVTPWVLDQLARYRAQATFFCIGRNAEAHPAILERIRAEGHGIGNHTWNHTNGWRTDVRSYVKEVLRTERVLAPHLSTGTELLFRPPYGRISPPQLRRLRKRYTVVMWDVLSADFDVHIDGPTCFANVADHVRSGSIVVFHDSIKAEPRLRHALPLVLEFLAQEGYAMKALRF